MRHGLGARDVTRLLGEAGCRDFFVSSWAEANELGPLPEGAELSVLHGVGPEDVAAALANRARPVLNSPEQVARWKEAAPGHPCDLMVDTGMNRLGLRTDEIHLIHGLELHTLHSHLACADEDSAMNAVQRDRFAAVAAAVQARRYSFANSAGICLGPDYAFDLVRPGLALYGGVPRNEAAGYILQVAFPEAEIVQRRTIKAGETCGGVALHVTDRAAFTPVIVGIAMVKTAYDLYPGQFQWRQNEYEYEFGKNPFDVVCGTDKIRKGIESGAGLEKIQADWAERHSEFLDVRQKYLVY